MSSIGDVNWDARAAPWDGDNETLIRYAHQHTYSVKVQDSSGTIPLDVVSCAVTFDAGWSPYVQGVMRIRRPSAAVLLRLNPRLKVRVTVNAGYVLPGGVSDVHPLADHLWLSRRVRSIDQDTIDLQFQGGEYLVDSIVSNSDVDSPQDFRPGGWTDTLEAYLGVSDVLDFVQAESATGGQYIPDESSAVLATGWVPAGDPWTGRAGDNALGLAREICDRTDLWLRCDEFGNWLLSKYETDYDNKHEFRDGADGTVVTAAHDLSREGWANWVNVVHNWSRPTTTGGSGKWTTTEYTTNGLAYIATGPYAVDLIGRVAEYVVRDSPSSEALCKIEATNILGHRQRNQGAWDVESIAAYWLRPGQRVNLSVEGENPGGYTVRSVTFDLDAGRMACQLVQPAPPDSFTTA